MTQRTCPGHNCGTPTSDYLCRRCIRKAERIIGDLPALAREIETTVTRQARITSTGHRKKGDDMPAPMNLRASQQARGVFALLFEWADHVAQAHRIPSLPVRTDRLPLTTVVAGAVAVLLTYSGWMGTSDQGPDLANAVWCIQRDLRKIIDRPTERIFAGPCGTPITVIEPIISDDEQTITAEIRHRNCTADLYATPGKPTVKCRECHTTHTAVARKPLMLADLEEQLFPLKVILSALPTLIGRRPDAATVRQWRHRKLLTAKTINHDGIELYRGGDVIALTMDATVRPGPKRRDGKVSA